MAPISECSLLGGVPRRANENIAACSLGVTAESLECVAFDLDKGLGEPSLALVSLDADTRQALLSAMRGLAYYVAGRRDEGGGLKVVLVFALAVVRVLEGRVEDRVRDFVVQLVLLELCPQALDLAIFFLQLLDQLLFPLHVLFLRFNPPLRSSFLY